MKDEKGQVDLDALFSLSYGLYVVTSCCGEKLNGQISNTVFQVSDNPPMVATCVSKNALTHECISKTGAFAVSVLDQSTPLKFIGLFGFRSGREVEKLSQVSFERGVTGCPMVMDHAIAVVEAKVVGKADVDRHTLFIGEVVTARRVGEGDPLTYAYYREHLRGKTPKNAPTHGIGPKEPEKAPAKEESSMKKYVCDVCGWIYDPAVGDPDGGIGPGTPFEKLPDDWVCPVCGVGKDQFSLVK